MKNEKRGVVLNPQSLVHFLDHLCPVASLMQLPFLTKEVSQYTLAQSYYPDTTIQLIDDEEFTPKKLFDNYDVLFMSNYFADTDLVTHFKKYEQKFGKKMRVVNCPHGFSDKEYYLKLCVREDIVLVYGQNMLDMLRDCEVLQDLKNYVITGNLRYQYFKKHKEFYCDLVQKEILSKFAKKQPIILYAPTHKDSTLASSFFEGADDFLRNLPSDYNMIVKLHPRLDDELLEVYKIQARYEKNPNIVFVSNFPLIYPILEYSDIYLGDRSSIGYDFLTYNRPMFFLDRPSYPEKQRPQFLHQCGVVIPLDKYKDIYSIISKNLENNQELFAKKRQEMYQYTFGEEKKFEQIRAEVIAAYNKPL